MKKRGSLFFFKKSQMIPEIYFKIITFVLITAIALFFGSFLWSLSKGTLFQKTYLSKDISLLTTVIYASPGDLHYRYFDDKGIIKNFNYKFENSKVIVVEADNTKAEEAKYTYVDNKIIKSEIDIIEKPAAIDFSKTEDEFSIKPIKGLIEND